MISRMLMGGMRYDMRYPTKWQMTNANLGQWEVDLAGSPSNPAESGEVVYNGRTTFRTAPVGTNPENVESICRGVGMLQGRTHINLELGEYRVTGNLGRQLIYLGPVVQTITHAPKVELAMYAFSGPNGLGTAQLVFYNSILTSSVPDIDIDAPITIPKGYGGSLKIIVGVASRYYTWACYGSIADLKIEATLK